ARLPALRAATARRVHLRRGTTPRPRLADRSGRPRLRRGLGLREPRRDHERALVPFGRLSSLAHGPPRHERRPCGRDRLMAGYAERRLEILARDRARFGVGVVSELPELVASLGATSAFVVTDSGVVTSGVVGRVIDHLQKAGIRVEVEDGVEPNPGTAAIVRGSERLRSFTAGSVDPARLVVVGLGGGSAMDSAKVIALHATNQRAVMSLGYHDETVAPGLPVVSVPTTAGPGSGPSTRSAMPSGRAAAWLTGRPSRR